MKGADQEGQDGPEEEERVREGGSGRESSDALVELPL